MLISECVLQMVQPLLVYALIIILTAILGKYIYSHFVQLFIDFLIILIVFTKLGDQGTIRQRKQLRIL